MREIVKAGSFLAITSGEYEDFRVCGIFVALRDFDPIAEVEELDINADRWNRPKETIKALVERKLITRIPCGEFHFHDLPIVLARQDRHDGPKDLSYTPAFDGDGNISDWL
jgi:hypothetical protein